MAERSTPYLRNGGYTRTDLRRMVMPASKTGDAAHETEIPKSLKSRKNSFKQALVNYKEPKLSLKLLRVAGLNLSLQRMKATATELYDVQLYSPVSSHVLNTGMAPVAPSALPKQRNQRRTKELSPNNFVRQQTRAEAPFRSVAKAITLNHNRAEHARAAGRRARTARCCIPCQILNENEAGTTSTSGPGSSGHDDDAESAKNSFICQSERGVLARLANDPDPTFSTKF
ncbi:hypothetical protein EVAR_20107_1 [Eumeta japonica]|uniref:Uncharacterized protein n=1 Tax=Eumeta variegata TaxID=151549 RepID=A0A4C1V314_EUMVA|nr:hypothetical protein EVAR_20107_1 [Eumeta japonica]